MVRLDFQTSFLDETAVVTIAGCYKYTGIGSFQVGGHNAGVFEARPRKFEQYALLGIHPARLGGRDTKEWTIKRIHIFHEAALNYARVVTGPLAARPWKWTNYTFLFDQYVPQLTWRLYAAGKFARHSDNSDV